MTDWSAPDAVDRLLFDGEDVVRSVEVAARSRVDVTTHRVLVFTPDGDGPNFSYADLPNVEGVEIERAGRGWLVGLGVRALVIGGFLLAFGSSVDFGGLFGPVSVSGAEQVGVGGMVAMFDVLRAGAALLDDALLVAGVSGVLLGVLAIGGYLTTRERALVIRVAGGDDLRIAGASEEVTEQVREAVA